MKTFTEIFIGYSLRSCRRTLLESLNFFLSILLKQSKMAIKLLSSEAIEKILSPKQLAIWQYLQSVNEATPGEIAKHAKVVRPTANQMFVTLLRLKKIERLGLGKSMRYKKV